MIFIQAGTPIDWKPYTQAQRIARRKYTSWKVAVNGPQDLLSGESVLRIIPIDANTPVFTILSTFVWLPEAKEKVIEPEENLGGGVLACEATHRRPNSLLPPGGAEVRPRFPVDSPSVNKL